MPNVRGAREIGATSRGRPSVDNPTYLRITRRITEKEYREKLDRDRASYGLPPIRREESHKR